jgi:hypothetical protein
VPFDGRRYVVSGKHDGWEIFGRYHGLFSLQKNLQIIIVVDCSIFVVI